MAPTHQPSETGLLTPACSALDSSDSGKPAPSYGDGFSANEICETISPGPPPPWHPAMEYEDCEIRDLQVGPHAVMFMGRVANIFDVATTPKTARAARGCLKLSVKDSVSTITVRLWYAKTPPAVKLGSLVSVWTSHVSAGSREILAANKDSLYTSLFPERDRNCHLMVHENSDQGVMYRTPLDHRKGLPLDRLMTLQAFLDGGWELVNARVLVLVKSLGTLQQVVRQDQSKTSKISLRVYDHTAEAAFILWGTATLSPGEHNAHVPEVIEFETQTDGLAGQQPWKPGKTILLLQSPRVKLGRSNTLSLAAHSIVDVDPQCTDVEWLRKWAVRQTAKEAINTPFPEGVFDLDMIRHGPVRCLFTLADLDQFARAAPQAIFQGYLSVIVLELKLYRCWIRNMLLCGECCGTPAYANAMTAVCQKCEQRLDLRLNPDVIGEMIDETGAIAGGHLVFSNRAWRRLLGRRPEDLLAMEQSEIKDIEECLLYNRLHLAFGWSGDETLTGGRICVLDVFC